MKAVWLVHPILLSPTTILPVLAAVFASLVHICRTHASQLQILIALRVGLVTLLPRGLLHVVPAAHVQLANTRLPNAVIHQTQYVLPVLLASRALVYLPRLFSVSKGATALTRLLPVLPGATARGLLLHPALAALVGIALLNQEQILPARLDPFAAVLARFQSVLQGPTALSDPPSKFHALWASSVQRIHRLPLSVCWAPAVGIPQRRSCAA